LCKSYNGGGAAPAIGRAGADSMVIGVGAREGPLCSGQNRPNSSSCASGIQSRRGPVQPRCIASVWRGPPCSGAHRHAVPYVRHAASRTHDAARTHDLGRPVEPHTSGSRPSQRAPLMLTRAKGNTWPNAGRHVRDALGQPGRSSLACRGKLQQPGADVQARTQHGVPHVLAPSRHVSQAVVLRRPALCCDGSGVRQRSRVVGPPRQWRGVVSGWVEQTGAA
jgi:hypothetical protein